MLLAGCDPPDTCHRPPGALVELVPVAERALVVVIPPFKAPIRGSALALAAVGEDRLMMAGPARNGRQLWSVTVDNAGCLADAWRRELGPLQASATVVEVLADGGLVVGGAAAGREGGEDDDAWIGRFAADGTLLWELRLGEFLFAPDDSPRPSQEHVTALAVLANGTIAAAGAAHVNGRLHSNWVLLVNAEGRLVRRIDLPRDDPRFPGEPTGLIELSDGGLRLAGTLWRAKDDSDAWILSVGREGEVFWDRTLLRPGRQAVRKLAMADWFLWLAGDSEEHRATADALLLTLNAAGRPRGELTLRRQAAGNERLEALLPATAGGWHLAGTSGAAGGAWIMTLDLAGRIAWSRELPGGGSFTTLLAWPHGGIAAAGSLGTKGPPLLLLP